MATNLGIQIAFKEILVKIELTLTNSLKATVIIKLIDTVAVGIQIDGLLLGATLKFCQQLRADTLVL